jgi:hypothetical protein
LPDELDPQVREFASQLRRLVDRSGLSVAAVADRTGYSKTSWERYLNGRLLAPKRAIVALAEVTGTNPVHLTTMWELAERAWSRSEMRHDMTMEAIRISQARAALGEFGAPPANAKAGSAARKGGSATVTPKAAGPVGATSTVPSPPTAPDRDSREGTAPAPRSGSSNGSTSSSDSSGSAGGNSWKLAGYRGPSPAGGRTAGASEEAAGGAADRNPATPASPAIPSTYGEAPRGPRPGDPTNGSSGGGRRRLTMFLAGVVGVLVVIGAVFFFTNGGGEGNEGATQSPSSSASAPLDLPAGVKCSGADCTGKDAESMGCSGNLVTTTERATVGTVVVEVRYSETCGAAWGRITQAGQGDAVQVTVGANEQSGSITETGDTIAYTPMVGVKDAGEATACVTLAAGQEGCTK